MRHRPRYVVRHVYGYMTARKGNTLPPQASAMVLDTLFAWQPVAIFRSEDSWHDRSSGGLIGSSGTIGILEAQRRARREARRLNTADRAEA